MKNPFLLSSILILVTIGSQAIMEDDIIYGTGKDEIKSYKVLEKPFRMNKVNLLWEKARLKLSESKLVSLYSELKIQDKEELTLKRLKAEAGDKDGTMEAQIRKKMNGIMNVYGLAGAQAGIDAATSGDNSKKKKDPEKALFKDKKLQRLWEKAAKSGLTEDERMALKTEFMHHEDKVEEFRRMSEMGAKGSLLSNDLEQELEDDEHHERHDNSLSGKAKEVKEDFQRLHRLATNTHDQEFKSEQVQGLWQLAQEADFDSDELDSLREELHHFQVKINKFHHLEAEIKSVDERHGNKAEEVDEMSGAKKTQGRIIMDKKLKKHMESIDHLQKNLEYKIASRHSEL